MNIEHTTGVAGAAGTMQRLPAPREAHSVALHSSQSAEEGLKLVLQECAAHIGENMAVTRMSDDPEGPHQLRVALRRLRSALLLFRPLLDRDEVTKLNNEARWLGAEVGRLRDLDVVCADILGPQAEAHPTDKSFADLKVVLAVRAVAGRQELRATLADRRTQRLLRNSRRVAAPRAALGARKEDRPGLYAAPLRDLAAAALAKRWKRTKRQARGLADFGPEERHALRKELKKLRYTVDFCAPLFPPKQVRGFLRRLNALQSVFGDLNDAAVAERLLADLGGPDALRPEVQRAVGRILGAAEVKAERHWEDAQSLWNGLKSHRPFWA